MRCRTRAASARRCWCGASSTPSRPAMTAARRRCRRCVWCRASRAPRTSSRRARATAGNQAAEEGLRGGERGAAHRRGRHRPRRGERSRAPGWDCAAATIAARAAGGGYQAALADMRWTEDVAVSGGIETAGARGPGARGAQAALARRVPERSSSNGPRECSGARATVRGTSAAGSSRPRRLRPEAAARLGAPRDGRDRSTASQRRRSRRERRCRSGTASVHDSVTGEVRGHGRGDQSADVAAGVEQPRPRPWCRRGRRA